MSRNVKVSSDERDALYKFAFQKQALSNSTKETLGGAGIGALLGAGMGLWNHLETPQDEDESKLKRVLRHVLGGAALGGVTGAGLGYLGVPGAVRDTVKSIATVDAPKSDKPRSETWKETVNEALASGPAHKAYNRGLRALLFGAGGASVAKGGDLVYRFGGRRNPILDALGKNLNPIAEEGALGRLMQPDTWTSSASALDTRYKNTADSAFNAIRDLIANKALLKDTKSVSGVNDLVTLGNRLNLLKNKGSHTWTHYRPGFFKRLLGHKPAVMTLEQLEAQQVVPKAIRDAERSVNRMQRQAGGRTFAGGKWGAIIAAALAAGAGAMTGGSGQKPVSVTASTQD